MKGRGRTQRIGLCRTRRSGIRKGQSCFRNAATEAPLMHCPSCASNQTHEWPHRTARGYPTFRCSTCHCRFTERTGPPFNHLQFPTDIVLLVVLGRRRYTLSLRDLAEMFLVRGFAFTHETVHAGEAHFTLLITQQLRAQRKGQVECSWYVDETYLRVGATGPTGIVPLTEMGIGLIRCCAKPALGTPPRASSTAPQKSPAAPRRG